MSSTELRVGRFAVPYETAQAWVSKYVANGDVRYGYPAYDAYLAEERHQPLRDVDLLAPLLLNAGPNLDAYYWLSGRLDELNVALSAIDPSETLIDADLGRLAPLFRVLDREDRTDVRITILAKVLHRKRPGYIPLYDSFIRECYTVGDGAPVPTVKSRSDGDYMVAIAGAMRADLLHAEDEWRALADLASNPTISVLRALDIVAWNVGRQRTPVLPAQSGAHGSLRTSR